jgi:hypothetical protein
VPDAGERYLILQSILGAWPVALLGSNAEDGTLAGFGERIEAYVVKALRDAKREQLEAAKAAVQGKAPKGRSRGEEKKDPSSQPPSQ